MMKRGVIAALGILLVAAPVRAQEPAAGGTDLPAASAQTEGSTVVGIPRRAPQPRTMAAEWPVYAAFSLTWVGIVAYMLVIGRRSRRVAAAVERLEGVER